MTNDDWNELDAYVNGLLDELDLSDTDWAEQDYLLGQDEDRAHSELEDDDDETEATS